MQQVLFTIPFINLPLYGFGGMLFFCFVFVVGWGMRRAAKVGLPAEKLQDMALVLFLTGIAGARVVYMIQYKEQFAGLDAWGKFLAFFEIWNGGIVFYGSIFGGLIGFFFFKRFVLSKLNVNSWQLADAVAPLLALGLAIGRIGCYLNGCCWGQVAVPEAQPVPLAGPLGEFPLLPSYARPQLVYPPGDKARLPGIHGLQTTTGFSVRPASIIPQDPRSVVISVEPNSAASKAGLKPGDKILKVNGVPNDIVVELSGDGAKVDEAIRALVAIGGRDGGKNKAGYAKVGFDSIPKSLQGETVARTIGVQFTKHDELWLTVADWPEYRKGESKLILEVATENEPPRTITIRPATMMFFPTQLYETISMVLLIGVLLAFQPFRRHDGQVMVVLMLGYAMHRFLNEAIRIEPTYAIMGIDVGLTLSQWISVFIALAALGLELYLRSSRPKLPPGALPLGYTPPKV